MYYDNKRSFYIKQYGPKVLVIGLSIFLVGIGTYIYIVSSTPKTPSKDQIVVASDNLKDENQKETTAPKDRKIKETPTYKDDGSAPTSNIPKTLESLRPLQKTPIGTVESVTSTGVLVVSIEAEKINVNLLGADFKSSPSDVADIISKDLKGKEIKLAFDKEKKDKNGINAYVYIDDTLYNVVIIEKGYATLKKDKNNTKLIKELTQAQAYAKQTEAGLWASR
ncbi:MAG: thermonuclease family protein [Clostridia bacterium]